ncbi:hypothetical protein ISN45_At01g057260 [Arabidopsis thaliana x Arabidopsis arenosa]|uniref:Uncharacterized protein n=2 Tax=Arabidopsis TaxID=3701 RepID=A0A8T2DMC6_ARASU|nr:hypothetical protein ISN44_As05g025450 [Arabidopsis suecica]KAG7612440.1 hypothetical protein ISN44_As05g044560 [Arabidopsis suecica]KAG7615651.1 hypothetical protein ISN45_At04g012040 [Arabidopsis thaliana x Arabidopsis arenosa]KAG7650789.1 hypothetical protein ISN45_At01g057260 [Arabidopsis thaliana x Arabidopsis arenosa]KAG7658666.1 hypothetical protein ISN44_As01g056300 [Arabidopsis suecica]
MVITEGEDGASDGGNENDEDVGMLRDGVREFGNSFTVTGEFGYGLAISRVCGTFMFLGHV